MCNSIFIDKKTLPEAKDGKEYEATIRGVYRTDENGVRKFDVTSVDGRGVADPDECGCGEDHNMNSDDALNLFIIKKRKEK